MEALQQALQATLSPQKAEREAAQKYLLDLRSAPDQITVLLRVVAISISRSALAMAPFFRVEKGLDEEGLRIF